LVNSKLSTKTLKNNDEPAASDQYSLTKILVIWLMAALPMGILGWLVAPALSPDMSVDPIGAAAVRMGSLTLGLVWLFVLSMLIVWREEGDLQWATIKRRLWLNKPRDPKTGERRNRLWLWLLPIILLLAVIELIASPWFNQIWLSVFPLFAEPASFGMGSLLEDPEIKAQLVGAWWFLAMFLFLGLFNIIGEGFIFRGVLLPKMNGVFGKWDWVANGVLMATYHWHQPWMILGGVIACSLFSFATKHYRSIWMGIIPHSIQIVLFTVLILGIILGLV